MKYFSVLSLLIALISCCSSATGEIITFDFEGVAGAGVDLDGKTSGFTVSTVGGISLTLTATAIGGEFNQNRSGTNPRLFGINAPTGADDSDAFDGGETQEIMEFRITSNVALSNLTLVSFEFDRFGNSPDDVAAIAKNGLFLGGFPLGQFTGSDLNASGQLVLNESGILPTDTISLIHVGSQLTGQTQGFGLEFITFEATTAGSAAVPEPGMFGAIALMAAGFFFVRRSQNSKT